MLYSRWAEIDLQGKEWVIPGSRMKAKREHRVPLSDGCIGILERARKLNVDPVGYLFPGTILDRPLSDMALLMVLSVWRTPKC